MCGIAAIFNNKVGNNRNRDIILKMISTISYRGPDEWGIYITDEMAIGHVRLSIIDLINGHQPMTTDRYVMAYNGEVYNHVEIRDGLEKRGVIFQTTSDTEVVLKAIDIYGTEAFKMFNGQYAIILYDKKEKCIISVRDRYGIRPLYILKHNGSIFFASEMKAFDTIDGFERTFNHEKLLEHALLWNTLGNDTIYNKIRSLPAGTYEIFKKNGYSKNYRYYEIGETQCISKSSCLNSAKDEFESLLFDSVRLRLRSDVPVATYLSGGIDSSVVTYISQKIYGSKLKTFAICFSDKEFDESKYQREMASFAETEHHEVFFDYKKINDHFFNAVRHFERPVFRTAGVPLYLLSKEVLSDGLKVVLTGEGADEILWGYDSFKELKMLHFWSKQPESKIRPLLIKKLYPHLKHYKNTQIFGLMKMYYEGFLNCYDNELSGLNIRVKNNQAILKYFNKDIKSSIDQYDVIEKIRSILPDNFYNWSLLQQNQFLEMKTLLSGYLLSSQGDRMSMAHSIEGRYPFLDYRLVEKLFYLPDNFKLNGFLQKYLLSEAFKNKIPQSIIKRSKKPYTTPDLKSFFYNGNLSRHCAYFLSDEKLKDYGLFNAKFVRRLLKKFRENIPLEIGYRDNMIITFILSCQMAKYWARHTEPCLMDNNTKSVHIEESGV